MDMDAGALIYSLERRRLAALVSGDLQALADLLSADLIYGHSNGAIDTKHSLLDVLRSKILTYLSVESKIDATARLGDEAVVGSGRLITRAEVGGRERTLDGRYLCVWRQEGGIWRLQALQGSNSWTIG